MEDGGPARSSDQPGIAAAASSGGTSADAVRPPPARAASSATAPGAASTGATRHMPVAARRVAAFAPRELVRWGPVLRLPTLIYALAPVLVAACWLWARGAALAWWPLLATLLAAALVLMATHLLAAYFDHARLQRQVVVPASRLAAPRANPLLAAGIYPLDALRVGAVLCALAIALGAVVGISGGMPVWLLGMGGMALALLYAATGPSLKRLGLAELVAGLALGPGVVAFTILAQGQAITSFALWMGIALGLYAAAWVAAPRLVVEAPVAGVSGGTASAPVEARANRGGRLRYVAILVAAYLAVLVPALLRGAPHGALAVLFSLPVAVLPLTGALRSEHPATLPLVVRQTVRVYLAFTFWLAIGLLLGGLYLRLLRLIGA